METTSRIRHENFLALFRRFKEQHAHLPNRGMLKLFAERLDFSQRYCSHLKCGRKNIGANVARQVERRMRVPVGWLDNPHTSLETTNELERNFVETALALYRSAPADARALMLDFLRRRLGIERGS